MKKLLSFLLVFSIIITLVTPAHSVNAAAPALSKEKLTLSVGKSYTLKLLNISGTVIWSSDNKKVASITAKGKIKALSVGHCTIIAENKGKKYKCSLNVTAKTAEVILPALLFDKTSPIDYSKQFKLDIPQYISVKPYDDAYVKVIMYDKERLKFLKKYNASFNDCLKKILSSDGFEIFTDMKADKLFKSVKIYTDKESYQASMADLSTVYTVSVISDTIQGLNLIDAADRKCSIRIIDTKTGKLLYPAKP
ncbi:Ig-like domain-containing protein [Anaerocolumna xylanovorans]|uniref:Ig-like domain (Group 2) n=1 Tax=Anaerocolumna xylanovorans DSM 12503 TaxID=1121345 RepID=A0A1M7YN46_9FIRM|nr:Ig-like domain-containing protein [Anaerocolumna xylanovorans]SHO54022.1 Ig-like domain (group 2) [Anaerocolumna xylanovorans DSM 12503]